MKRATLTVLTLLALGPRLRADGVPLDTFSVNAGVYQAAFFLPATIPTEDSIGDAAVFNVPVLVDDPPLGEGVIDFDMFFTPVAAQNGPNFSMTCFTGGPNSTVFPDDLCFIVPRFGFTSDPFTESNGLLTFIPGSYADGNFVITGPQPTLEPGTLLLLGAGLVGLGLCRRRFSLAISSSSPD